MGLRVPRLQEIPAPEIDKKLKPWVPLPKSPEKTLELKIECVTYDGKHEIGREQLGSRPEVKEVFDWYVENQWEHRQQPNGRAVKSSLATINL